MPSIESQEEAQQVARLLRDGRLEGPAAANALAALRDYDAALTAETDAPLPSLGFHGAEIPTPSAAEPIEMGRRFGEQLRGIPAAFAEMGVVGPGQLATWAGVRRLFGKQGNRVLGTTQNADTNEDLAEYALAGEDLMEAIRGREDPTITETTAKIALAMFAGRRLPASQFTVRSAVANALKTSPLFAATVFDPEASTELEKSGSMALGTALATGTAGLISGLPASAHYTRRWYIKHLMKNGDEAQQEAIQRLVEEVPGLWDYLTLGQRTGSKQLQQLQASVEGPEAAAEYRTQTKLLLQKFKEIRKQYGDAISPEDLAKVDPADLQAIAQRETQRMAKVRTLDWDTYMARAERSLYKETSLARQQEAVGTKITPIEVPLLKDKAERMIDELNQGGVQITQLVPQLRTLLEEGVRRGVMPLGDFIRALKFSTGRGTNVVTGMTSPDQQRYAGRVVQRVLFSAVDDADSAVSGAIDDVKRARNAWRVHSAKIRAFEQSALAKALGLKVQKVDVDDALTALQYLPPGQQAKARELMKQTETGQKLLSAAQARLFDDAWRSATSHKTAGADELATDPVVYADAILKKLGDPESPLRSLLSDVDAVRVRALMSNVRAIDAKLRGTARTMTPEEGTMNVGNVFRPTIGNLPFLARAWYRLFAIGKFSKLLSSPEGRTKILDMYRADDRPALQGAINRAEQWLAAQAVNMGDEEIDPDAVD